MSSLITKVYILPATKNILYSKLFSLASNTSYSSRLWQKCLKCKLSVILRYIVCIKHLVAVRTHCIAIFISAHTCFTYKLCSVVYYRCRIAINIRFVLCVNNPFFLKVSISRCNLVHNYHYCLIVFIIKRHKCH